MVFLFYFILEGDDEDVGDNEDGRDDEDDGDPGDGGNNGEVSSLQVGLGVCLGCEGVVSCVTVVFHWIYSQFCQT